MILFCHGKEGTPEGTKAKMIRKTFKGCKIPDNLKNSFCHEDFKDDLKFIEQIIEEVEILVGSSRGGALVLDVNTTKPKIVIAPAWKKFGVIPKLTKHDTIIHSKEDDLVPIEDSEYLMNKFGCRLVICGKDHRMSDEKTLEIIKNIIKGNLKKVEQAKK